MITINIYALGAIAFAAGLLSYLFCSWLSGRAAKKTLAQAVKEEFARHRLEKGVDGEGDLSTDFLGARDCPVCQRAKTKATQPSIVGKPHPQLYGGSPIKPLPKCAPHRKRKTDG